MHPTHILISVATQEKFQTNRTQECRKAEFTALEDSGQRVGLGLRWTNRWVLPQLTRSIHGISLNDEHG